MAAPSLYKHVGSLAELRHLAAARIMDELTSTLTEAALGRSGDDAVAALMRAFRTYIREHPARYLAVPADPLGVPALAPSGSRLLAVFLAVLRGYGLDDSGAIHATRCLRSAAHGFSVLEASGGFGLPEDLDQSYEQLIAMVLAGLPRPSAPAP